MVKVAPEATLWPPDPQEPVPSVPPSDKPTGPPRYGVPRVASGATLNGEVALVIAFVLAKKWPVPFLHIASPLTPHSSLFR